jgi:hypothetical protein
MQVRFFTKRGGYSYNPTRTGCGKDNQADLGIEGNLDAFFLNQILFDNMVDKII